MQPCSWLATDVHAVGCCMDASRITAQTMFINNVFLLRKQPWHLLGFRPWHQDFKYFFDMTRTTTNNAPFFHFQRKRLAHFGLG